MRKTLYLITLVLFLASSASAANLTVEILDSDDNRIDSQLELRQDGGDIAGPSSFLDTTLTDGENYTLIQNIDSGPDVTIYNFSINQDLDLKPTIYRNQNPEKNFLTDTDPLYFVNQDFNFSKAEFTVSRDQPDSIAKCNSISSNECSSWTVESTSQYESSYSGSTFKYNVTSFSGYTSGQEAPLPEIQNIQIFNVSEVQDQRNNGELVDEGLNKTFQIKQQNPTEYRFEFNVSNNGSDTWILTTDDELSHRILNQSWPINETDDIYYRINGSLKEGGTFNSGEVDWNTGNGGELEVNESLSAEYIVNVTQDSTNIFDQYFNASTTSSTSDQDYHQLKTKILGFLDLELDRPQNNSVVQNNRAFTLNGTVSCVDGDCGDINSVPRQNESTGQEQFTGSEFETLEGNSTCSTLFEGQNCVVNWSVNATADPNTFHELDFKASSNYSEIEENNTEENIVEVRDILMIDLDWDVVDFGVLDPGEEANPAENNSDGYNLTVEEDSNTVDNLWLKASSLVSEQNSNYTIAPGNMSWAEQNSYSASTNFTSSYSILDTELSPGTTKTLYYWLDVPYGITSGGYTGTMTFKANRTQ